jgi:putative phosphoesterase
MRIGLLSDSHGNIPYIKKVGRYLKEKAKVDLIVHLGDEFEDADVLDELGIEIMKVPGVFSSCYQDPATPNRLIVEIEGVKLLITHSCTSHPNDLPEDGIPADIVKEDNIKAVFYGHTHVPKIEDKDGVVWINPGHLQESDKKGNPASFAIVKIEDGRITSKIIKYDDIAHEL